jgi:hypothetical protein
MFFYLVCAKVGIFDCLDTKNWKMMKRQNKRKTHLSLDRKKQKNVNANKTKKNGQMWKTWEKQLIFDTNEIPILTTKFERIEKKVEVAKPDAKENLVFAKSSFSQKVISNWGKFEERPSFDDLFTK